MRTLSMPYELLLLSVLDLGLNDQQLQHAWRNFETSEEDTALATCRYAFWTKNMESNDDHASSGDNGNTRPCRKNKENI